MASTIVTPPIGAINISSALATITVRRMVSCRFVRLNLREGSSGRRHPPPSTNMDCHSCPAVAVAPREPLDTQARPKTRRNHSTFSSAGSEAAILRPSQHRGRTNCDAHHCSGGSRSVAIESPTQACSAGLGRVVHHPWRPGPLTCSDRGRMIRYRNLLHSILMRLGARSRAERIGCSAAVQIRRDIRNERPGYLGVHRCQTNLSRNGTARRVPEVDASSRRLA
jgi:hypothetical protein